MNTAISLSSIMCYSLRDHDQLQEEEDISVVKEKELYGRTKRDTLK